MNDRITRRELLRRSAVGGAALTVPSLLAACGGHKSAATTSTATLAKTLTISNWPLDIDYDKKTRTHPSLAEFQKKYGVHVNYLEDVTSTQDFFAKISGLIRQGQPAGRDLMTATDWAAFRMLKLGWLEKLDTHAIPNRVNIISQLKHPSWDPNRQHSMPYNSYMYGLTYDSSKTGPITSVDQLFTDPHLKGKVQVVNEMTDTISLVMLSEGDDPSNWTAASFNRAIKKLKSAFHSGQIRTFAVGDDVSALAQGSIWAALAYTADVDGLHADHPEFKFVIPTTGGIIGTDNMVVPKGGNAYTASVFLNFILNPKVGAKIIAATGLIPAVRGIKQAVAATDPAMARDPLVFPTTAVLNRVHAIDPKAATDKTFNEKFQALLGA